MTIKAETPEDITRLFVERANAGDVDGLVELYEPDAVLAYPPGSTSVGHDAIRAVFATMLQHVPRFEPEDALPTVRHGDLALTSTAAKDGTGGRVQVVRRQAGGGWLRVIDRPEQRG
ncbi:nuclear transport factor 2 family protein [Dactylosporangium salmoneum]|uniref:SnoaL-like domain-containing protein n=1 Tax=Dactylosporangium salmoneum TaxID=53361 RepID=A0ABN3HI31_9ACTN